MNKQNHFYLCPTCFAVSETMSFVHEHRMIQVDPALLGDDLRCPPVDAAGRIQSRAPRWFLQRISNQHDMAGM